MAHPRAARIHAIVDRLYSREFTLMFMEAPAYAGGASYKDLNEARLYAIERACDETVGAAVELVTATENQCAAAAEGRWDDAMAPVAWMHRVAREMYALLRLATSEIMYAGAVAAINDRARDSANSIARFIIPKIAAAMVDEIERAASQLAMRRVPKYSPAVIHDFLTSYAKLSKHSQCTTKARKHLVRAMLPPGIADENLLEADLTTLHVLAKIYTQRFVAERKAAGDDEVAESVAAEEAAGGGGGGRRLQGIMIEELARRLGGMIADDLRAAADNADNNADNHADDDAYNADNHADNSDDSDNAMSD